MISRVQEKSYEPTIEWDVYLDGRWIGTVLAPSTTDRGSPRDADALRIARAKFDSAPKLDVAPGMETSARDLVVKPRPAR